jgi:hypothetical protein
MNILSYLTHKVSTEIEIDAYILLVWHITSKLKINFSRCINTYSACGVSILTSHADMWFISHFSLFVCLDAQVEIHHASEVDEIFDAISYDKGASFIRMLQSYLGTDRFQV